MKKLTNNDDQKSMKVGQRKRVITNEITETKAPSQGKHHRSIFLPWPNSGISVRTESTDREQSQSSRSYHSHKRRACNCLTSSATKNAHSTDVTYNIPITPMRLSVTEAIEQELVANPSGERQYQMVETTTIVPE